jgi:hypothetical protein
MVDFRHFEPREVAPGASVTILVSSRLGPRVSIPLHSIPERAAAEILREYLPDGAPVPGGSLQYLVGESAYRQMMALEGVGATRDWPSNVQVIFLHGAPMNQD